MSLSSSRVPGRQAAVVKANARSSKRLGIHLQIATSIAGPYILGNVSSSSFLRGNCPLTGPPFSSCCQPIDDNAPIS
ncbi:hypothetical protein V5799_006109 [Amblyomma americanum]|uniref:Uncharacterized protein n=1 Tax=Amblyomma americanum TaxID=6943 RepID=A0AAQ4DXC1_AMBAM